MSCFTRFLVSNFEPEMSAGVQKMINIRYALYLPFLYGGFPNIQMQIARSSENQFRVSCGAKWKSGGWQRLLSGAANTNHHWTQPFL